MFGFPLVSIAYGFVLVAAVSPRGALYSTRLSITSFLAAISYSLYLVHKGMIHLSQLAMAKLGVERDGVVGLVVCVVASVAAAWVLHLIVERPFMAMRTSILAKRNLGANRAAQPA